MKTSLLLASLALLPLCSGALSPSREAPAAVAAAAESFKIDPVHSSVMFRIKHKGVSWFYGRFNDVSGDFVLDAAEPAKSSIRAEVRAENVDTGNKGRDDHLRGPDFLNAKEFPILRFESSKVARKGEAFEVEGALSLHGVTKPVKFLAEHTGSGKGKSGPVAGMAAEVTFKRSDFGMTYGLPDSLGDEVTLYLGISGAIRNGN